MLHAICHGYEQGFGSRLVLHSLPDLKTVFFYENLGFQETGEMAGDMMTY